MCTGVGGKWLIGAFLAIYGKIVPPEIEEKKAVLGRFLAFLGKNERGFSNHKATGTLNLKD